MAFFPPLDYKATCTVTSVTVTDSREKMYNIGYIANNTDYSVETIRHYEKIGLLHKPKRTPQGHRRYDDEHVRTLNLIVKFRAAEFSLKDIDTILKTSNQKQFCSDVNSRLDKYYRILNKRIEALENCKTIISRLKEDCLNCKSNKCDGCKIKES